MVQPEIMVENDYDGYFESWVREWIESKTESGAEFKHKKVVISAGPYRPSAVSYRSEGDTIYVDFYAALRTGFGSLDDGDEAQMVAIL